MLTDPPNEDTDYAYSLHSKQLDGGKAMEAEVLLLPGFSLFVLFHIDQIFYCYKNIAKIVFSNWHHFLMQSCVNFNEIKKLLVLYSGKLPATSAVF